MPDPEAYSTISSIRDECCADWPKPCSYHEGWLDGAEFVEEVKQLNEELGVELATAVGILHAWSEILRRIDGPMLGTMTRQFLARVNHRGE